MECYSYSTFLLNLSTQSTFLVKASFTYLSVFFFNALALSKLNIHTLTLQWMQQGQLRVQCLSKRYFDVV